MNTPMLERYIAHPQTQEVLARMQKCLDSRTQAREPLGLLVTGPSGVGKTMTAERFRERYPSERIPEGVLTPVLMSFIPSAATIKGVQTELLHSLGDHHPDRGTRYAQATRLYTLLDECGVELIVLDEIQHLISRRNYRVLQDVCDWLKLLISRTHIPIVLMGVPEARHVLDHDRQLARRFSSVYEMRPFGLSDKDQVIAFRKFLLSAEKAFIGSSVGLAEEILVIRMYAATGGLPSEIIKLLREAVALADTPAKVTTCTLAQAFDETIGCSHERPTNPFTLPMARLRRWKIVELELGKAA